MAQHCCVLPGNSADGSGRGGCTEQWELFLGLIHKDLVFLSRTLSTCLMLSEKHTAGAQRDQQQEVQDGYLFRYIKMLMVL